MTRPTDWTPLYDSDPLPGDPDELDRLHRRLRRTADAISAQVDKLKRLCTDEFWDSDAGREFTSTAEDTGTTLLKAYQRYDAAATAISDYEPVLREQQALTVNVLKQAQHDEEQHRKSVASATADDPKADTSGMEHDYQGVLEGHRRTIAGYVDAVHTAAGTAAGHLDDTIHHDGLKDGWTDKAKNWIHEHADIIGKIADIAGWVATVCGTLALAVCWIPIVGQALAGVLGTIALVATGVSLLCHLALYWSGDGGLLDIGLDVLGLVTFGVGRAATGAIRLAAPAVRASGKLAAATTELAPRIAARGGTVTRAVEDALSSGDLNAASRLSGLRQSLLKGWMGNELGELSSRFGSGGLKGMLRTIDGAPGRFLPRLSNLKDALNPVAIGRETWEGMNQSVSPSAWREGLDRLARGETGGNPFLDEETSRAVREVTQVVHGLDSPALSRAVTTMGSHLQVTAGNFVAATSVDVLDKFGLFDGGKEWGTRSPQW